jgi:aspartate/methionine/tyrosine aminotransferase
MVATCAQSIMLRPAQRTLAFGETIFSEITALAQRVGAVNLGQGFPDFAPPEFVLEAARAAAADGAEQQYARGDGLPELARAVAASLEPRLGRAIDPLAEVTVTVGATEALFATTLALLDPGDEAILIEPFYDSYPADVAIAGGRCRHVPLRPAGGRWELDLDELARAFGPRTRALYLNTPHNPTGKVFSRAELERVAELCVRHDAVAVCDEVYEQILYDGARHLSLASLPGMAERSVTISSVGKTFSATGWKIGWAVACPAISTAIRRIHQWIPFCVARPLQRAAARVLELAASRGYYDELRRAYRRRRDRLLETVRAAGLEPLVPEGAYYVMVDFARAAGHRFADDVAFCRALTTEVGVAAIPPSAFYSSEHRALARSLARLCFCKDDETLGRAAERLAAARW